MWLDPDALAFLSAGIANTNPDQRSVPGLFWRGITGDGDNAYR
jgi:hypothetical protein